MNIYERNTKKQTTFNKYLFHLPQSTYVQCKVMRKSETF